jgi:hypothetical protein
MNQPETNIKYFDFADNAEQEEYLQEQYKNQWGLNEDGEDEYTVYLKQLKQNENNFLKKMKQERYDELNDIRLYLPRYNYFVRVFKKHYGTKRMNEASFPLVLYNYINKFDNFLLKKKQSICNH